MKTIVAPTDFSDVSINAVNYAADMAAAIHGKFILLHAVGSPVVVAEMPVTEVTYEELDSEDELTALKKILIERTKNTIPVEAKLLWGALENELIKFCEYEKPFAIVMGTHGDGVAGRFFLESTTVFLARHFRTPVLVVPDGKNFKPVMKIILATDLKRIDDLPLKQITRLVHVFNATLDVVYVKKPGDKTDKHSVENLFVHHPLMELNPHFHLLENNNVQKAISWFAEQHHADLVLILPKKHGLFHKSDSRQLIFHSPVPVMAIHEE